MAWFAVPVEWTLQETVLVQADSEAAAVTAALAQATGRLEECDASDCEARPELIEVLADNDARVEARPQSPAADEYRVDWSIDVSADSPRAAAERALEIQRNPDSIATYFDVTAPDGTTHAVDLLEDTEHE